MIDGVGNWTERAENGKKTQITANEANAYTKFGSTNLDYDRNGNMTDDGTNRYEYDAFNRITSVYDNETGKLKARYSYDAHNRRMRKVLTSDPSTELRAGEQPFDQAQGSRATSDYTYSAWQVVAEYEGPSETKQFIYGQGIDSPVTMITFKDGKAQKYFYQTDHLGSITALTDESGKVVKKYRYDAYGKLIQLARDSDKNGGIANPYLYTGRHYDEESGLYYYRNRYYSAELGRFMTRDPVKYYDGMNMYAYVNNQPTLYADPLGLWKESIHNKIIDKAFKNLSWDERYWIKKGSEYADSIQFQTGYTTYMHAMRQPGEDPGEARRKMNAFVDSHTRKAARLMSQNHSWSAYAEFGMAIHPLMDSTSPSHEGFQEWSVSDCASEGIYDCGIDLWQHGQAETEISPSRMRRSVELLHQQYAELLDLTEALTRSNGKRKTPAGSNEANNDVYDVILYVP